MLPHFFLGVATKNRGQTGRFLIFLTADGCLARVVAADVPHYVLKKVLSATSPH